jgi:hypothetical protein
VAWFAVAAPAIDAWIFWPEFRRRSQADPAGAWTWLGVSSIGSAWLLFAVGAALWISRGQAWASLGFTVPGGWRLWTSIALVVLVAAYHALAIATLARSSDARTSVRQQFGTFTGVPPHTRTELRWFGGVSLTAGFWERTAELPTSIDGNR